MRQDVDDRQLAGGPAGSGGDRALNSGVPVEDRDRPLFMISVAAELAGMHPQTLRLYERRGLIRPQRSARNTRRYSLHDVERLRRIQQLTELGLNLAGVQQVLAMEEQLEELRRRVAALEARLAAARDELRREVERVERAHRHDLVPVARAALVHIGPRRRHL